ncbi:tRNA 5-methylaminomethyl-2-thiouridine biosynthesis bifunctional protein MnmC [Marinomonas aquimarina]|uniref:tRNA 5-methylaminomethyl-2-thiouridine biosynthesis bifunctional protein MnmC n=1 Tax=Marinomonas aquimarina TaxID=295068 RepID=A0A1A8TLM6_9GAMM|nr:FAD-dependent oxidoreductase [Marinomonas aquimarina]SBS33689.1 tRNA 5-methylaminomethyl-2-thiouridine biosynthesis bifunctional protein MnmC [Marinomonas aquimarina]
MTQTHTGETVQTTPAKTVAVIGAGAAGSTIALRLAELGIDTTLIERGPSLVNGPPFCHLHAGGNLYREISDEQCLTLLKQSIDTVKVYPQSINVRPTLLAVPQGDRSEPMDLLPRLEKLRDLYQSLVKQDADNQVLGQPEHYFRFYERAEIEALAQRELPEQANCDEDWLVAFAKQTNLDALKFPLVMVQEYGLSAFRWAAIADLAIARLPSCHLQTSTSVINIQHSPKGSGWLVSTRPTSSSDDADIQVCAYDYVVNACGFKSGELDDMIEAKRQRMVEFKASFVTHWPQCNGLWPEVVFHGERGTPQGMAQLTPYPGGYFQLHGMTQAITLFQGGLVASCEQSSQPKLAPHFLQKIDGEWPEQIVHERTEGNINHIAQFIPSFKTAETASKPLFGAQQIPGEDPDLRAADVSFHHNGYARAEIVKASSALATADAILKDLLESGVVTSELAQRYLTEHYFPVTQQCGHEEVTIRAEQLARERHYPDALARVFQD